MNGPQHFKEAERLIIHASSQTDNEDAAVILACAQVHATLALAAATAAERTVSPQQSWGGHDIALSDPAEWR